MLDTRHKFQFGVELLREFQLEMLNNFTYTMDTVIMEAWSALAHSANDMDWIQSVTRYSSMHKTSPLLGQLLIGPQVAQPILS